VVDGISRHARISRDSAGDGEFARLTLLPAPFSFPERASISRLPRRLLFLSPVSSERAPGGGGGWLEEAASERLGVCSARAFASVGRRSFAISRSHALQRSRRRAVAGGRERDGRRHPPTPPLSSCSRQEAVTKSSSSSAGWLPSSPLLSVSREARRTDGRTDGLRRRHASHHRRLASDDADADANADADVERTTCMRGAQGRAITERGADINAALLVRRSFARSPSRDRYFFPFLAVAIGRGRPRRPPSPTR